MKERVFIVGAGPVAIEYYNISTHLGYEVIVVGRGERSATHFYQATGRNCLLGGVLQNKKVLSENCSSKVIVAVSENEIDSVAMELIRIGFKDILVEKPGASTMESLSSLSSSSSKIGARVCIAYNRRYFSSVIELQKRLIADGGVDSFHFEFTEWAHVIEGIEKAKGVKANWLWHNSTHVIDLAFFLGGMPTSITSLRKGSLSWHPAGSSFVGCGESEKGALFTYQANWEGPGRWGLEFITKKNRYYLRPMEQLKIQKLGSVKIENVKIDNQLDISWKPGFFLQTRDFLLGEQGDLLTVFDMEQKLATYRAILNGQL